MSEPAGHGGLTLIRIRHISSQGKSVLYAGKELDVPGLFTFTQQIYGSPSGV